MQILSLLNLLVLLLLKGWWETKFKEVNVRIYVGGKGTLKFSSNASISL